MHDLRFVSVTTHPLVAAGLLAAHSNTVLIHKSSTIHSAPNFMVRFNTTMACLSALGTSSTTDKNNWLSELNIAEAKFVPIILSFCLCTRHSITITQVSSNALHRYLAKMA